MRDANFTSLAPEEEDEDEDEDEVANVRTKETRQRESSVRGWRGREGWREMPMY